VHVPSDMTLADLSEIIQTAIGWDGFHLYGYHVNVDELRPSGEVLPAAGCSITYLYDLGDQ
jgi:hypothetical protein